MRQRILALSLGSLLAMGAHANQLSQVTIYQGNALIERTASTRAGEQTLVFDCLSHTLDYNSIQLSADDGVQLGEIQTQLLTGNDAKHCQSSAGTTQDELIAINAKIKATQSQITFLNNLARADNLTIASDIERMSTQMGEQMEQAERNLHALNTQKSALEARIRADGNSAPSGQVNRVSVRLHSPNTAQVRLNYLVNHATWQPQYQARLNTRTGKLDLNLQARIRQQTGEYWQNAKVILSSSQPSQQSSSQPPYRMDLSLIDNESLMDGYPEILVEMAAPAPMMRAKMVVADAASSFDIDTEQLGDIVTYSPTQRLTLAGDGKHTTLNLESVSLNSDVFQRVNLGGDLNAYWYASAKNLPSTWLPANMQLYRDGSFVGTGRFDSAALTQLGIGFGRNALIEVRAINQDKHTGQAGILGGKRTQTIARDFEITSQLPTATQLEVLSGIPVAKDSQISVKSSYEPAPISTQWQQQDGIAHWQFKLDPKAKVRISQTHTISHPKDSTLHGLD